MGDFLLWFFFILIFALWVPIKIAVRFNKENEKLEKLNFWSTNVVLFLFEIIIIYAYYIDKIDGVGLFFFSVFLVGLPSCWILLVLWAKKKEEKSLKKDYLQTQQRPEQEDYGLSESNPIWTNTVSFYFDHLYTQEGQGVRFEKVETIELEKDKVFSHLYIFNGFLGCELAKYDVYVKDEYRDTFYICTHPILDKIKIWHAPKGYVFK